ncbi:MAG: hypothetical protein ACI4B5_07010 [Bacteroidaceae bacterium]
MKKLMFIMALGLLVSGQARAQETESAESREAKRAEMIAKSGERLAKSFGLDDSKKESFLTIYTEYQTEMFATNERPDSKDLEEKKAEGGKKEELTDAQATERIKANFERQEKQVAQLQKRLEIQKRYYTRFAEVLTPSQTLKAMFPQRTRPQGNSQQRQGGMRPGGFGERGGGFGGPGGPGGF